MGVFFNTICYNLFLIICNDFYDFFFYDLIVIFALFLAMLYSGINDGQKSIQDKQGLLFFITINQSFGPLIGTLAVFLQERPIVTRERQSKSYHLISYYLTKLVTALPLEVLFPCIFGSIVYFV